MSFSLSTRATWQPRLRHPPPQTYLSRRESLAITESYTPSTRPFYVDGPGLWQAGGWYYFLWQKDDLKALFFSGHPDVEHRRYYVKHWNGNKNPSRDDIVTTIHAHVDGLQQAILRHGVITKRGFELGRSHVWCTNDIELYYDSTAENPLYLTHLTSARTRRGPLDRLRWIPRNIKGIDHPVPPGDMHRERRAELEAGDLFHNFMNSVWEGSSLIHGDIRNWNQLSVAYMNKTMREFGRRHNAHRNKAVNSLDVLWEVAAIATGGISIVGTAKSVYTVGQDVYAIARGKPSASEKYPGLPDGNDPIVRQLSNRRDKYIDPFRNFFRRANLDTVHQGQWLQQEDFGFPGLFSAHGRVPDLLYAELSRVARPTRESQVRFYFQEGVSPEAPLDERLGAVRIHRADGLVVTLTSGYAWFYYDKERHRYTQSAPMSDSLRDKLADGRIIATGNLLGGEAAISFADLGDLNSQFKKQFGVRFHNAPMPA